CHGLERLAERDQRLTQHARDFTVIALESSLILGRFVAITQTAKQTAQLRDVIESALESGNPWRSRESALVFGGKRAGCRDGVLCRFRYGRHSGSPPQSFKFVT